MNFCNEDKKKVFAFFEKLLMKYSEPVYYELLRGHVTRAEPVVREFVRKKCKGEDLLKYFKNRHNYFEVNFRNEVNLIKRKPESSPYVEKMKGNTNLDESVVEHFSVDVFTSSEHSDYSRSNSVSSVSISDLSLDDKHNYVLDHTIDNERNEYHSPVSVEIPQNAIDDKIMTKLKEEEKCNAEQEEEIIIDNFLACVEFFAGILKKKFIPLKNLRGYISQAPPVVKSYMKSNYENLQQFLLENDKLFRLNDVEDVSLAKDAMKAIKSAKKLYQLKPNIEFSCLFVRSAIHSLFRSEYTSLQKQRSKEDESNSYSKDIESLDDKVSDDAFLLSMEHQDNKKPNILSHTDPQNEHSDIDKTIDRRVSKSKFDESIYLDEQVDISAFGHKIEKSNSACNETKEQSENPPNSDESSLIEAKKYTQRTFVEFAFTAQLLCLEIVEKENILCLEFEYEAVKYFVEILENLPEKNCSIDSVKGYLGQTSKHVNSFMKQLYKGEKIHSFFLKNKEFVVNSSHSSVKLSASYRDFLEQKKESHELFLRGKKLYNISDLYNCHLHEVFAAVLDCISKICSFLQNKSKIKFNRLNGIFSKFSALQQDFINSLSGASMTEKLENFLHHFLLFNFPDEYIEINPDVDVSLLVSCIFRFNEKLNMSLKYDKSKLPCFNYLYDYSLAYEKEKVVLDLDDLRNSVIEPVQLFLSYTDCLDYSDLVNILGFEVTVSLVLERKDSQDLIRILEESNLFELKNGKVSLKLDDVDNLEPTEDSDDSSIQTDHLINKTIENIKTDLKSEKSVFDFDTAEPVSVIIKDCQEFEKHPGNINMSSVMSSNSTHLNSEFNANTTENTEEKYFMNIDESKENSTMNKKFVDDSKYFKDNNPKSQENRSENVSSYELSNEIQESTSHSISSHQNFEFTNEKIPCKKSENRLFNSIEQNAPLKIHEKLQSPSDLLKEEKENLSSISCKESEQGHIEQSLKENAEYYSDNKENFNMAGELLHDEIYLNSKSMSPLSSECKKQNSNLVSEQSFKNDSSVADLLVSSSTPEDISKHYNPQSKTNEECNTLFLQPLSAKVILITMDSCIVETFINERKKYLFCLKSSFHCDEHSNCSDCFDSLAVGDTLSCYIPPSENLDGNKMCFSFMFCKDSPMRSDSTVSVLSPSKEFYEECTSQKKSCISTSKNDASCIKSHHKSVESAGQESQTNLTGEVKSCFPVEEKECQVECVLVSHDTQTVEFPKENSTVERECQVDCQMLSKDTQTVNETAVNQCQTDLSGKVKICVPVCDNICQTSISGSIKCSFASFSSSCQTELSGQVQKSVILADSFSQTMPYSTVVSATTQTEPENIIPSNKSSHVVTSRLANEDKNDFLHVNNATVISGPLSANAQNVHCDTACQTISTGAVMITNYCLHE